MLSHLKMLEERKQAHESLEDAIDSQVDANKFGQTRNIRYVGFQIFSFFGQITFQNIRIFFVLLYHRDLPLKFEHRSPRQIITIWKFNIGKLQHTKLHLCCKNRSTKNQTL